MARPSSNQLLKMEQVKSCQLEKTSQRAEKTSLPVSMPNEGSKKLGMDQEWIPQDGMVCTETGPVNLWSPVAS